MRRALPGDSLHAVGGDQRNRECGGGIRGGLGGGVGVWVVVERMQGGGGG